MTLKAQNDRLPLTFAIRDISMDLKAHVELSHGEVRIRPAGPADANPTVLHLVFTAITRPMIDENAVQLAVDSQDDVPLSDLGDALDDDERRRLEGIGVRTVSKLEEMKKRGFGSSLGRITRLPVDKLESVLSRATRPMVSDIEGEALRDGADDLRQRLRVKGKNLLRDGTPPTVSIGGRPVSVIQASDREILLAPDHDQMAGQMSLSHDRHSATDVWFDQQAAASRAAARQAAPRTEP
ncbi:hypothetical protein [Rhizobacter sp. Root1221]|uniref:hypothetical protein n=1 Tax=Rhizobacter sp. Root1221 TaxID=1736433 RepID=UPI001F3A272D|nr:hypothetical protein [Rhizobacter sp. Root1221]